MTFTAQSLIAKALIVFAGVGFACASYADPGAKNALEAEEIASFMSAVDTISTNFGTAMRHVSADIESTCGATLDVAGYKLLGSDSQAVSYLLAYMSLDDDSKLEKVALWPNEVKQRYQAWVEKDCSLFAGK